MQVLCLVGNNGRTEKSQKVNSPEVEVETLVSKVEDRKVILFGGHGTGITKIKKQSEWQHVAAAVISISGMERPVPELRKVWSDIMVHIFISSRTANVSN